MFLSLRSFLSAYDLSRRLAMSLKGHMYMQHFASLEASSL